MPSITIDTETKRLFLLQAMEFMRDVSEDMLADSVEALQKASSKRPLSKAFDMAIEDVRELHKRVDFTTRFVNGLRNIKSARNCGVYVDKYEAGIIREAIDRIVDVIEGDDVDQVNDVLSEDMIKQAILKTNTSWGAVDPAALSEYLKERVNQVLTSKVAARELLQALA